MNHIFHNGFLMTRKKHLVDLVRKLTFHRRAEDTYFDSECLSAITSRRNIEAFLFYQDDGVLLHLTASPNSSL